MPQNSSSETHFPEEMRTAGASWASDISTFMSYVAAAKEKLLEVGGGHFWN